MGSIRRNISRGVPLRQDEMCLGFHLQQQYDGHHFRDKCPSLALMNSFDHSPLSRCDPFHTQPISRLRSLLRPYAFPQPALALLQTKFDLSTTSTHRFKLKTSRSLKLIASSLNTTSIHRLNLSFARRCTETLDRLKHDLSHRQTKPPSLPRMMGRTRVRNNRKRRLRQLLAHRVARDGSRRVAVNKSLHEICGQLTHSCSVTARNPHVDLVIQRASTTANMTSIVPRGEWES